MVFLVGITDELNREWILSIHAREEIAAARLALAELRERLKGLGVQVPKGGSILKVVRCEYFTTSPYELTSSTWSQW